MTQRHEAVGGGMLSLCEAISMRQKPLPLNDYLSVIQMKQLERLCSSLRIIAVSLLVMLTSVHTMYSKELDPKILNTYLRTAFADTSQLVKFSRIPSVSAYCVNNTCQPLLGKLDVILEGALTVKRTDLENSGADIEILLYPTTNARLLSKNQYTASAGEVLGKLINANCSVMQSRRDFEVTKVIISVTQDAGSSENLVCIMNELLRGAGVTVEGRYPEYLKPYLALSNTQFANTLRGLALFMAMHVSPATSPGQDQATVEAELKRSFEIRN
jgi:hypothetical protein